MRTRIVITLGLTTLLGACTFSAEAPQVYHCTAASKGCPDGYECNVTLQVCVKKGTPLLEAGADVSKSEAGVDLPKGDGPKVDQPKVDGPKADKPKVDAPKVDLPKSDGPKVDQPKVDGPKADKPKVDAPKVDAPKVDAPKVDGPKADKPKADVPKDLLKPDAGYCGDGKKNGTEQCDGSDLGGQSCSTIGLGFTGGSLACKPASCTWDTSKCTTCGNGVIETGEDCDLTSFPASKAKCEDYGRNGGSLICTNTCKVDLALCCAAPLPPMASPKAIVSASVGNDATSNPTCTPFKTITKALSTVGAGALVWVAPGTYDAALGETFPIAIPPGVTLWGDQPNKGLGTVQTVVSGLGAGTEKSTFTSSGTGAAITGFKLDYPYSVATWAITADGSTLLVQANTFTNHYAGVRAIDTAATSLCPTVKLNVFNTGSYGVRNFCEKTTIDSNTFNTPSLPIDSGSSSPNITSNVINGSGQVGIQIQSGAAPTIISNQFTHAGGYTYGAIYYNSAANTAGVVRKNDFTALGSSTVAISLNCSGCKPDLGTAADPGNNTFWKATLKVSWTGSSATTMTAIGNSWNPPPNCTYSISVAGPAGSKVVWGTGAAESCAAP